jgi:hypothetical protein
MGLRSAYHERQQMREAEDRKRLEACQVPRNTPAERPWKVESCRQAMSVWEYSKGYSGQTADTIDTVEDLLYDMNTGAWECESNRRFWLEQRMRVWLDIALFQHGYSVALWLSDLAPGKEVAAFYDPGSQPLPLLDWLPLSCIEIRGPWLGVQYEQADSNPHVWRQSSQRT